MNSETCMATRTPKTPSRKPGEASTEFQLHKSQFAARKNLFDYTEHRLKLYITQTQDEQQKATLKQVLADYKKGLVAVAWKAGKPVWINVTKETSRG